MPSTYSNLKIQLMATGENNTTWGDVTNVNLGTALEEAIVGSADVAFSNANVTLTLTDTNSTQSARNMRLNLTGTATTGYNLVVPAIEKPYIVNNGTDGTITVKNTTGTGIAVPAGKTMWLFNNGTNVVDVVTHLSSVTLGSALPVASGGTGATTLTGVVKGNGTSAFTAGTVSLTSEVSGTLAVANGGTGVTTSTGTVAVVLSNSPVLVTPTLGAASATSIANGLGAVGTPSYTFTGDLNTGMWSPGTDTVAFSTNGAERARIDSSGNVGIGTSSPDANAKLDVAGTVRSGAGGSDPGTGGVMYIVGSGSFQTVIGGAAFAVHTGANNARTERMRIDASGNVGIGTSSPSNLLHIARSSGNAILRVQDTSSTSDTYYISDSSGTSITQTGALPVILKTSNTERMRIDGSGNVGIGTSSPSSFARLAVVSSAFNGFYVDAQGVASNAIFDKNNTAGGYLIFNYSGAGVGSITTNGTTTSYNITSDARLKENIAPADDVAALIDAIEVRKFDWKSNGSHQRYGFIAQELVEVAPEAVHVPEDEEQMMAVDYSKLVPLLIAEVQSLRARVAQLEATTSTIKFEGE